jgi:hypothetical protein
MLRGMLAISPQTPIPKPERICTMSLSYSTIGSLMRSAALLGVPVRDIAIAPGSTAVVVSLPHRTATGLPYRVAYPVTTHRELIAALGLGGRP